MTVRGPGEKAYGGAALPFFSAPTREGARDLVVLCCTLANDGSGRYAVPNFGGTLEAMDEATERFLSFGTRAGLL